MILKICAVRDRAVEAFGQPIFVNAIGQAMRSFGDEINRKEQPGPMAQHPEDYDLYHLGDYDDQTGKLESLAQPRVLAVGKEMLNVE